MILFALIALVGISGVYSQPAGCTDINGLYECDYSTLNSGGNIPLSSASFTTPPAQRLRFTNIPSTLTSALFQSNFNNLDQSTTFDTNFPATLELKCTSNSAVTIGQNAFTYMGHVYDFKIINCQATLQANALTNFGTLDRFVIENGTIASFDADALTGVSIEKSDNPTHDFPVSTGELIFRDSEVTSGGLPATFLQGQTNILAVTLEGLSLTSIDATMFSNNTNLRYLSIGHNDFAELPSGLLDGLESLSELHLYNLEVDCSCDKLWFYPHTDSVKTKVFGDVICKTPADWENKKAAKYYYSTCVTIDESCSGLALMGACISWFELAMYCVCIVAFILGIIVLILAIHTKRQVGGAAGSKGRKGGAGGARKRPPPNKGKGPKGTKMGWS